MLKEFTEYIETNRLASKSDRILLAVSGGIDSMAMADLFGRAGYETAIVHCNFKLRGTDSDEDETFVKEYASRTNRKFYSASFNTAEYAGKKGISVEMAARELRYKWFEEIRRQYDYDLIAIGHNRNDNIETILINLVRGTGIIGLTGMKPAGGKLIRPLLFASRQEIEEYARSGVLSWREDKTNDELLYLRNRIRHQLLPVLRQLNPSFDITLTETAARMSEIQEILDGYIYSIRKRVAVEEKETVVFDALQLTECRPLKTILFELFRPYSITSGRLNDLINLLTGRTGATILTDTHRIIKNRNQIIATGLPEKEKTEFTVKDIESLRRLAFIESAEIADNNNDFKFLSDPFTASLDAHAVSFPLIFRRWRHGDRFQPLGMSSFKKLSDYFTDRKIPLHKKEKFLVLETDGEIAWITGERIDNRFKVTGSTEKILIIKCKKDYTGA